MVDEDFIRPWILTSGFSEEQSGFFVGFTELARKGEDICRRYACDLPVLHTRMGMGLRQYRRLFLRSLSNSKKQG